MAWNSQNMFHPDFIRNADDVVLNGGPILVGDPRGDASAYVLIDFHTYQYMHAVLRRAEEKLVQFEQDQAAGIENNHAPVGIKVLKFVLANGL